MHKIKKQNSLKLSRNRIWIYCFSEYCLFYCFFLNKFICLKKKRHRLAEWIQEQDPSICCLQETHFRPRDTYRLKVRGWQKIFHANGNKKKAGVAILISDKLDFKIKNVTRDKEGHYIMIMGSIQKEDITIINKYAPNIGAPQYIRQLLTAVKRKSTVTQ